MSRTDSAVLWTSAACGALLSACGNCPDHDASETARELAQFNFDNGKYDQAKILFSRCVEKCPDSDLGWMGLANSCREEGNSQFKYAADMAGQGKIQESKRGFKDAVGNHLMAFYLFQRRLHEKARGIGPPPRGRPVLLPPPPHRP